MYGADYTKKTKKTRLKNGYYQSFSTNVQYAACHQKTPQYLSLSSRVTKHAYEAQKPIVRKKVLSWSPTV